MKNQQSVAIIGAGVIGVTCAAYLARQGYRVSVFDQAGIAEKASSGNAGAFAYFDFIPNTRASMLLKAPKWLLNPLSPLTIPPRYFPKMIPWLTQFALACRPGKVDKSKAAMTDLMNLSRTQAKKMWQDWQLESMIHYRDCLHLYQSEKSFLENKIKWIESSKQGFSIDYYKADEIKKIEPCLKDVFAFAVKISDIPIVSDPKVYTKKLAEKTINQGVSFNQQNVNKVLAKNDHSIQLQTQDKQSHQFDKLVLAAGAWSGELAEQLGDKVPLKTERGYNTTSHQDEVALNHMLFFPEYGFVASDLQCGLRIGGAVELANAEYPENFQRANNMFALAQTFIKGLKNDELIQWMGARPSLPDMQPVIDHATRTKNVIYAFGHGHYGLTQSAATAKLVCQLINKEKPSISLDAFRVNRF